MTKSKHYIGRKKDGVLDAMKADGIQYAVSVGRRQPMHQMHLECVQEIVDAGLKPVLLIGSANDASNPFYDPINNPLNEQQQRKQLIMAATKLGLGEGDYTIISLPDFGDDHAWTHEMFTRLRKEGIDPAKCVSHFRSKEDHSAKTVSEIKAMNDSVDFQVNQGFSVWESYNTEPDKMDGVSATVFRGMDLRAEGNQDALNTTLVAPGFIREQAEDARSLNPNLDLLKVPITMLDLTLQRMREERNLSTRDILRGEPAFSLEQLTKAINAALEAPGTNVTGELHAAQPRIERTRT